LEFPKPGKVNPLYDKKGVTLDAFTLTTDKIVIFFLDNIKAALKSSDDN